MKLLITFSILLRPLLSSLTNSCSRVLIAKLIVVQVFKKFPAFYGVWRLGWVGLG